MSLAYSIYADCIYYDGTMLYDYYLNFSNGIIEGVSKNVSPGYELIDRKGHAIFPGFINTHTHLPMVFFRGMADDLPLMDWLNDHIWPAESKWLSDEFVYDATLLSAAELIRSGTICANDMYFFSDKISEALTLAGLKGVVGVGVLDFPTKFAKGPDEYLAKTKDYVEMYKDNPLIDVAVCPHAIYTVSPENYKKCILFAEKYDVTIHTHLSETEWEIAESMKRFNKRPVAVMEETGMLDTRSIFAHCVHLTNDEIELLGRKNANISICAESNLKLGSGFSPVKELFEAGATLSIGTDGAASNNDLNMMGELSTVAKLHKGLHKDPTVLDINTVLNMGTQNGATAMGLQNMGSIQKGNAADFIVVSYNKPHMQPVYNHLSHLIYSANSSDISDTFVNGKPLMLNYKLTTINESAVIEKANDWLIKIKSCQKK